MLKEAGISQRCCLKRGASQERSRLLGLVPRNPVASSPTTVRPSCRSESNEAKARHLAPGGVHVWG